MTAGYTSTTPSPEARAFASLERECPHLHLRADDLRLLPHRELPHLLFEDVLRRTLRLFGYRVTQVMNLTDVDDKTIRGANAAVVSLREYTDRYAAAFFEDLDTLRIERAEHYPRATDHIPGMVRLVRRLEEAGVTYRSEGSVYYRIASFPGYGKLSGVRPDANRAGARVDADEYEKEDARDFVLWKAAKPGEPAWETELGRGRPGWHLECSAMSMEALGETFDIHCGGVDNIFPHHENEIAQSEGATGRPFARFWLHAEHLLVEGEKMAKSLGNVFTVRDLLERGHDPLAIRYLLISVPYRQKLNFTFDGLHAAEQALERIANTLRRLEHALEAEGAGALAAQVENSAAVPPPSPTTSPRGPGRAPRLLRAVNTALDGGGISGTVRDDLERAVAEVDAALGVVPTAAPAAADGDAEVAGLVEERTAARAARDFARADAIRARLAELGVAIEDTPHGTVWHRKKP
jgi:cysteinyl-tRNA synthetase